MNSGVSDLERILALKEPTPGGIQPMLVKCLCCLLRLLVRLLADLVVLVDDCLDLLLGDHALADELLAVDVHHVGVLLDDGVHDRLREHRLVYLVVAESPAMANKGLKFAVTHNRSFNLQLGLSMPSGNYWDSCLVHK